MLHIEMLEDRFVLSATYLGLDVSGDISATSDEFGYLRVDDEDHDLSSQTPAFYGPIEFSSNIDIPTFVLDFKSIPQANTTDFNGNVVSAFDVTAFGFGTGSFNTIANSILNEVKEDFFSELDGTVAGPLGQDLKIDFIIGDIGSAPAGRTEYYYVQIGTGVSGPEAQLNGVFGVARYSGVRNGFGMGPNNGIANGSVVASIFTDDIAALSGLSPSNALTSGNLEYTKQAISGTVSHEIGHTLSLLHTKKAGSVQPMANKAPIMGTGAIDLPNQDRITDRQFFYISPVRPTRVWR